MSRRSAVAVACAATSAVALLVGPGLLAGSPRTPARPAPAVALAASQCPAGAGGAVPNVVGTATVVVAGCAGYLGAGAAGRVSAFGAAQDQGDMSGYRLAAPIVDVAAVPGGTGYYLLGADGGIFSFGSARFYGSTGNVHLAAPVVAMAVTPTGQGYWLVAADGGIFSFGDARFYGSTGGIRLNQPVVSMAPTATGHGYWLVAKDGGVFSFGDARFHGSTGDVRLVKPITGIYATPDGGGYTLVATDGGVFAFGDAHFYGSLGGHPPAYPIVGLSPTVDGTGYTLVDRYGEVFTFGDAQNFGSAACPVNASDLGVDPNLMADTGGGSQLMTVQGSYYGNVHAIFTAWDRRADGCWVPATLPGQPAMPYTAEVGLAGDGSGANLRDHRSEGDGTTPTGIYDFESTIYGNSTVDPNPAWTYHHLVCGDWWDESPASAQYNQFVHVGSCSTVSPWGDPDSEALWTETSVYQHFAVINYNPPPTSDPIGAAIFLHDDTPLGYTAGCVALPNAELDAVLAWMAPASAPHMAIGTAAEMPGL